MSKLFKVRFVFVALVLFGQNTAFADHFDRHDAIDALLSKDYKVFLEKIEPIAREGSAPAQSLLGTFYVDGQGISPDYAKGFFWLSKAAEQGHDAAMPWLGDLYCHGFGVEQSAVLCLKWVNIAASRGNEKAIKYLPMIEDHVTSATISEAQKLARDWRPKPAK
jgi:hypothetical protein